MSPDTPEPANLDDDDIVPLEAGDDLPAKQCSVRRESAGVYVVEMVPGITAVNQETTKQMAAALGEEAIKKGMGADAKQTKILLAVDFKDVTSVEKPFLLLMAKLAAKLNTLGGNMAAINVGEKIRDAFRQTRIPYLIQTDSLEAAKAEHGESQSGVIGLA